MKITNWSDVKKLTFKVKIYSNGEWVAQCKEVSGIMTGNEIRTEIEEAVCSAMNVNKIPKNLRIVIQTK